MDQNQETLRTVVSEIRADIDRGLDDVRKAERLLLLGQPGLDSDTASHNVLIILSGCLRHLRHANTKWHSVDIMAEEMFDDHQKALGLLNVIEAAPHHDFGEMCAWCGENATDRWTSLDAPSSRTEGKVFVFVSERDAALFGLTYGG